MFCEAHWGSAYVVFQYSHYGVSFQLRCYVGSSKQGSSLGFGKQLVKTQSKYLLLPAPNLTLPFKRYLYLQSNGKFGSWWIGMDPMPLPITTDACRAVLEHLILLHKSLGHAWTIWQGQCQWLLLKSGYRKKVTSNPNICLHLIEARIRPWRSRMVT